MLFNALLQIAMFFFSKALVFVISFTFACLLRVDISKHFSFPLLLLSLNFFVVPTIQLTSVELPIATRLLKPAYN